MAVIFTADAPSSVEQEERGSQTTSYLITF